MTGVATTGHVFVLALLFGIGTAFDNPARQSFVAEVAGPEHLPNAIGLNSASFHGARIVGPALAGLVIAAFGSGWAIMTNALTYLAFLVALLLIDRSRLHLSEPAARAKRQIREGLAYVRRHDKILLVMCVAFFVGTFGMNFQMTSALMAQQEFGLGAGGVRRPRLHHRRRLAGRRPDRRPTPDRPERPVRGDHGPGLLSRSRSRPA